jgi:hypothetical protein
MVRLFCALSTIHSCDLSCTYKPTSPNRKAFLCLHSLPVGFKFVHFFFGCQHGFELWENVFINLFSGSDVSSSPSCQISTYSVPVSACSDIRSFGKVRAQVIHTKYAFSSLLSSQGQWKLTKLGRERKSLDSFRAQYPKVPASVPVRQSSSLKNQNPKSYQ